MDYQNDIFSEELLNEESKSHLLETAKWNKFLAIVGMVSIGFMILGLLFLIMGSAMSDAFGVLGITGGIFIYIIILALYIYPVYAMYNFNKFLKLGIHNSNPADLAIAFNHQKGLYRFLGIITIILLAFYLIMFLFGSLMSFM